LGEVILFKLFQVESLIIGGDLNFTINHDEIWGVIAWEDKLANFFKTNWK
jgi:hypothetical protein